MKIFNRVGRFRASARSAFVLIFTALALGFGASAQAARISEVTYYHPDRSGSPIAASDEGGNLTWSQRYEPYGYRIDAENNANAAINNSIGYVGQYEDKESGQQLVYMQGRYYDPVLGRFLGVDPAGFNVDAPGTFNQYAYSFNNPYRYIDPDGEFPFLLVYWGVQAALTAYDTYTAYQDGGITGAAKHLAVDAALSVAGAGIAKKVVKHLPRSVTNKTVGRHMSPDELAEMKRTGRVQEGGGGQTRVADPADPKAYRNPPEGDVYVEFDVPADRVLPHSKGTGRIPGPNSPDARVPGRNPSDYEMPSATDIKLP